MRRHLKMLLAFTMAALMIFGCASSAFAESVDTDSKFTPELTEIVESADDASYICVAVYLTPNEDEFTRQLQAIGAQMKKFIPLDDFLKDLPKCDSLDAFLGWGKEVLKTDAPMKLADALKGSQFYNYFDYEALLDDFIAKHDLAAYFPEFKEFTDAPCLYLKVTKDKLLELAKDKSVAVIDFKAPDAALLDMSFLRSFDSSDALKILREAVSNVKTHFGPSFDVNSDGVVNSDDALAALRVSVGYIESAPIFDKWETFKLFDTAKFKESDINIIRPEF